MRATSPAGSNIEVLNNWLAAPSVVETSIDLSSGPLAGRTLFAYAGNMGAAQGMDCLIDLAVRLRARTDAGFLFVGRGSEVPRLRARATEQELDNVQFIDEVDADQIPALLAQCHVGLIALDPRHTTHNIPGKLLTYLHVGLPVLARINPGNDLETLINEEGIGHVVAGDHPEELFASGCGFACESGAKVMHGGGGPIFGTTDFFSGIGRPAGRKGIDRLVAAACGSWMPKACSEGLTLVSYNLREFEHV